MSIRDENAANPDRAYVIRLLELCTTLLVANDLVMLSNERQLGERTRAH